MDFLGVIDLIEKLTNVVTGVIHTLREQEIITPEHAAHAQLDELVQATAKLKAPPTPAPEEPAAQ